MPSATLAAQLDDLPPSVHERLRQFHFDRATFLRLGERLRSVGATWPETTVQGRLDALVPDDIHPLPERGTAARDEAEALGRGAHARGEVAVIVLAGGMATRFGGAVKAAVPAWNGRSFLDLKLADVQTVAARADATVPFFLMASVATRAALDPLAAARTTPRVPIHVFNQCSSLRLTPEGHVFLGTDGQPSLYATGHGDLPDAFAQSGHLGQLAGRGGKYLVVSNVDNLAASLDPAIIGMHIASARRVSVEVVERRPADAGGPVLRVDGRPQIVESFRLPKGVAVAASPVFNTNTFVVDAAALAEHVPLDYFPVEKKVDGARVIQFERLLGQITSFVPSQLLRVPREGSEGRFLPIKDPGDLDAGAGELELVLRARGIADGPPPR